MADRINSREPDTIPKGAILWLDEQHTKDRAFAIIWGIKTDLQRDPGSWTGITKDDLINVLLSPDYEAIYSLIDSRAYPQTALARFHVGGVTFRVVCDDDVWMVPVDPQEEPNGR